MKKLTLLSLPVWLLLLAVANIGAQERALQTNVGNSPLQPKVEKESVTVPLIVEFNRPFVDLEFTRPDGSLRKARFWVDTGGGGFILCEPLAKDLNLKLGATGSEGGQKFAQIEPPQARLGGMALDLKDARAIVAVGQNTISEGVNAEGLFPGHILKRYHVIFDYPGRKFTLAKPGSLKPRGVRIDSPVNQRSGFPRIEAQIGGQTYGFLLDTGASYSMISQELLEHWANQNPDWQKITGAYGAANMGLGQMEAKALMMRIPEMRLANTALQGVAAISRPKGTFENYMSQMMAAPIKGALGGNLLSAFRIEIDYANGATYLEKKSAPNKNDLDIVGLTLRAQPGGSYVVFGVAPGYGKEILEAIRAGDRLIKVDKLEVKDQPLAKVIDSLRGRPNDKRTLVLERDGKQITVKVPVLRIL